MKIHTALKIGKFTFIVLILAFLFKIGMSVFYGYFNINKKYIGAFFYRWRVEFIDGTMAKSVYPKINANECKMSTNLQTYLDYVVGNKAAAENRWPYYSYNLQDTFIHDKHTWDIFIEKKNVLQAELKFLRFRNDFICKLYDIKFIPNADDETKKKATKTRVKFFDLPAKDTKKMEEFFTVTNEQDELKGYKEVRKDVLDLVKAIKEKPDDYRVTVEKDTANIPEKLSKPLLRILDKVIPEFNISEDDLSKFFYRISIIRADSHAAHILNRFYWYYFFARYDWAEPGTVLVNKNYLNLEERIKKLEAKPDEEEGKKGVFGNDKKTTMADYNNKKGMARQEIVFNDLSEAIGNILGEKGAFVSKKEDDRSLLDKIFGMGIYNESALQRR